MTFWQWLTVGIIAAVAAVLIAEAVGPARIWSWLDDDTLD